MPYMTWFDVLLVTLWGMVAALGWQLGPVGLLWAAVTLLALALAIPVLAGNLAGLGLVGLALLLLLGLVVGAGLAIFLYWVYDKWSLSSAALSPLATLSGLLGGVLLGGVLCAGLALSLPLSLRVDAGGQHYQYPSGALPVALRQAVGGSVLVRLLTPVWKPNHPAAWLIAPDQVHRTSE